MTLEHLVAWLSGKPMALLATFVAIPALSGLLGLAHGKGAGGGAPWRYAHSVLVYAACIPGMFSVVLTCYALFFRNEDLLGVNVLVYFLPVLSMAATLLATRRAVRSFDDIPGFGRLSGLMLMLGLSFGVAFALQRFRFGVFFFGSLGQLAMVAAVVFALLRLGANRMAGRSRGSVEETIRESMRNRGR